MPGSSAEPPQVQQLTQHKWAGFFGTIVALLALAIPTAAILYYSAPAGSDPADVSPSGFKR